ncbi:MAG: phosphatase family protein [Amycolatopsis sp.]|uniref:phosphatase PAP2 family protein n=1 Tax=Amycolatopsis sp. TaxID=37632 RepID=UPI00263222FE|nr:phosphatase PAP2 family protein [Amycolatopsis sp.]MCU1682424.1 phosphatase family protein [Amycolatopsis sp.]
MVERRLAVGSAVCALLTLALGLVYAGESTPGRVDAAVKSAIDSRLGSHSTVLYWLVLATQPYLWIPVILVTAAICLRLRRCRDAAFALLGPPVAIGLNSWVLKPLFDRHYQGVLVYPSGHTVSLVSTLTMLALLVPAGTATRTVLGVGTLGLVCACVGMIGLSYHYFTDIVGGTLFGVTVVLAMASLWPRLGPARSTG